ncbi:hypothetical protein [Spirosoma sp.]|uniref:hypothetical protein n=1 Tax=Spirosoma sp. TaxID=1899569 RepID=UPI0026332391|nr:hypothetical protein [Spirosoma sp.]MCX6214556.1 hypothetical protein [Spirosoma sp.]
MENELPQGYLDDAQYLGNDFGQGQLSKSDYNKLDDTISELTDTQAIKFLELVRDGVVKTLEDHKKRCQDPTNCHQLKEGDKTINSLERRINERRKYLPSIPVSQPETPNHPPDHTTARQVLAMKFLLEYAKINVTNDKAAERFLHFLTGKSKENLYKLWRNPYNKDLFTAEVDDLRFIRKFFEELGAVEIVKAINNEIDKP